MIHCSWIWTWEGCQLVNKLAIIAGILILILFFLPLILKNIDETSTDSKQISGYSFSNFTFIKREEGKKEWLLRVTSANESGKLKTILHGLEYGEIFAEGQLKYYLTADGGEYNRKTEDFYLNNNVVVTSVDGQVLKTDRLLYKQKSKQMSSGKVEIIKDDVRVSANEMNVDIDQEIYDFSGEVYVEFEIEDGQEESGGAANEGI